MSNPSSEKNYLRVSSFSSIMAQKRVYKKKKKKEGYGYGFDDDDDDLILRDKQQQKLKGYETEKKELQNSYSQSRKQA